MQLKQLLNDDDAVSPVIGVILMVSITVILAAVIGTFVLGLGDQVQATAPNTNIAFDYDQNHPTNDDTLEITHEGGDGISGDELNVVASGATNATDGYSGVSQSDEELFAHFDKVRAGDSTELNGSHFNDIDTDGVVALNSSQVRVVWRASGSGDSSTLRSWEGPDA